LITRGEITIWLPTTRSVPSSSCWSDWPGTVPLGMRQIHVHSTNDLAGRWMGVELRAAGYPWFTATRSPGGLAGADDMGLWGGRQGPTRPDRDFATRRTPSKVLWQAHGHDTPMDRWLQARPATPERARCVQRNDRRARCATGRRASGDNLDAGGHATLTPLNAHASATRTSPAPF
jgi:hypothetical protein